MQFLPRIKQATDAVINITTGGGHGMSLEERLAAPLRAKPEMCLAQHGLDELRPLPDARAATRSCKYDWERQLSRGLARFHLPQHLQGHRAHHEGARRGLRHALRVRVLRRRPPLHARPLPRPQARQAAALRADDLRHPRRHRRRSRRTCSTCGASPTSCSATSTTGRSSPPAATRCPSSRWAPSWAATSASASRTASIVGKGQLAKSNAEQVAKIRTILEELSLEIATPEEARAMLQLKGGDQVAF